MLIICDSRSSGLSSRNIPWDLLFGPSPQHSSLILSTCLLSFQPPRQQMLDRRSSPGPRTSCPLSNSVRVHTGSESLADMGLDRSNNIGIMLARLRLPPQIIRQIVWEADDEALDVDKLAMVARMLPTPDEVSRVPCSLRHFQLYG